MSTRRIALVLRIILGCVWLYAAYTKLRQPWLVFAMSIDAYRLLPEWAVLTIARTLPWLELAIGVLLIAGVAMRYVSILGTVILMVFFGVMLSAYTRGLGIDCGCFGLGDALSWKTLVRDGSLLLAAAGLAYLSWNRQAQPDRLSSQ